jgi:chaperonin GroEL
MPNSAQHFLHDLATYTDGDVFNGVNNPMSGENLLERLGQAISVTSGKYQTTFYAYPNQPRLEKHIAALKEQMPSLESDYDRDGQKKRISRLVGGIAVINLSTPTPAEFKEIRARIDDALCSIRSAQESGIVPGGGTTLLRAAVSLLQEDINPFNQAIARSLKAPIETLFKNAGILNYAELIKSLAQKKSPAAYDARNHKTVQDAFESGIVDPTKVAIVSLRSALSIANTLCNLGGLVTFEKKEQENDKGHPLKMG